MGDSVCRILVSREAARAQRKGQRNLFSANIRKNQQPPRIKKTAGHIEVAVATGHRPSTIRQ